MTDRISLRRSYDNVWVSGATMKWAKAFPTTKIITAPLWRDSLPVTSIIFKSARSLD